MIHGATLLLSLAGFVLLLLAMTRHQRDWLGRALSHRLGPMLRLAGSTSLVMALLVACAGLGWAYGTVTWFGWQSVAAGLVVAGNTGRERILRRAQL